MKFVRYLAHGEIAYGAVDGDTVRQVTSTPFEDYQITGHTHKLDEVRLLAPVVPRKILAMALNYPSHLGQRQAPKRPEPFWKSPSSVIGPDDHIIIPRGAGRVEEEGELVAVIGKRCKGVSTQEAPSYVLGYTCGIDVSAREWQRDDIQWWRAKSSDTFSPIGPFLVTGLAPSGLELQVRVNGKEVQHGNTSALIYDVPTIVSFVSQVVTLEPGDLIFTGTPGIPAIIKPADTVEVEIEAIGVLRNPVCEEK